MANELQSKRSAWARLAMLFIGGFAIGICVYAFQERYSSDDKEPVRPSPLLSRLRGIKDVSDAGVQSSLGSVSAPDAMEPDQTRPSIPSILTDQYFMNKDKLTISVVAASHRYDNATDLHLFGPATPAADAAVAVAASAASAFPWSVWNSTLWNAQVPTNSEEQEGSLRIVAMSIEDGSAEEREDSTKPHGG